MRIRYALLTVLTLAFASTLWGGRTDVSSRGVQGWSYMGKRDALTNADTLAARPLDYAHLAAADSLKLVVDANDTVRVSLTLIRSDSTRKDTSFFVNGTDTAYTASQPLFLESILIDSGKITDTLRVLRVTGDTPLTKINPNETTDFVAQFFLTKDLSKVVLESWATNVKTTPDTVDFQVRLYRRWEDARTYGAGSFEVLDEVSNAFGRVPGNITDLILSNRESGRGWVGLFLNSRTAGAEASGVLKIRAGAR